MGIFIPYFYFHGFQGKKHYCLHVSGPPLQHLDLLSLRTFKLQLCRETFSKKRCNMQKEKEKSPRFEKKYSAVRRVSVCHFATEVPSWHHSSAAQRSGTEGRRLAARRRSACRAPRAGTWPAFPKAGSLSWQPGKTKHGFIIIQLTTEHNLRSHPSPETKCQTLLFKYPKWKSASPSQVLSAITA